jgi:hypothetical protein
MISKNALDARLVRLALLGLSLFLLPAAPARALGQGAYSMEILVDGRPLREYAARGTTYVQALQGREYSIRLRNHTAHRIAVALSVDGLNSIDARTTPAREASKWILGPHETITLDGWQTSSSTARRFFFTTEERSYGAWLGRTRNLGLISAAVFREKRPSPAPIWKEEGESRRRSGSPADSDQENRSEESGRAAKAQPELSDDYAATGIGRKLGHSVKSVRFEAERNPVAVLETRYEYRDALVRLGVLTRQGVGCEDPLSRRERACGFDECGFSPDPYRPACP